jgi:hypothetical protein
MQAKISYKIFFESCHIYSSNSENELFCRKINCSHLFAIQCFLLNGSGVIKISLFLFIIQELIESVTGQQAFLPKSMMAKKLLTFRSYVISGYGLIYHDVLSELPSPHINIDWVHLCTQEEIKNATTHTHLSSFSSHLAMLEGPL